MLNLNYITVASAYHRFAAMDEKSLFAELGWSDRVRVPGCRRNDSVIMSLALLVAGAPLQGPLRVESGSLMGGRVECSVSRLADWLGEHHLAPELAPVEDWALAVAELFFGRRGIIAFVRDPSPMGGSIALLDGKTAHAACLKALHVHPQDVRFWPLN